MHTWVASPFWPLWLTLLWTQVSSPPFFHVGRRSLGNMGEMTCWLKWPQAAGPGLCSGLPESKGHVLPIHSTNMLFWITSCGQALWEMLGMEKEVKQTQSLPFHVYVLRRETDNKLAKKKKNTDCDTFYEEKMSGSSHWWAEPLYTGRTSSRARPLSRNPKDEKKPGRREVRERAFQTEGAASMPLGWEQAWLNQGTCMIAMHPEHLEQGG